MENPWRAPVVAVEDGQIKYWESGLGGCMLYHYGASGTTYLYIHLNNDLTPRNDNKGGCVKDVAFAVPNGAKVTAGQQIALERGLRRRERKPAPALRGAPERRRRREPVQAPEAREQAALRGARGARSSASDCAATLVAAGAGAATLEVDRVRQYPGGRWLDIDPREVELTVPLGADVAPSLDQLTGSTLRALKKPVAVAAFTLKANATPEAIVGAPGELVLGRVAPAP